jgi:2'-hydroxyisoflavone reductase
MKLLVLGGTRFLGRHFVDGALARGHTLTLFNRGRTNAQAFPDVETIIGDREADLSALEGRTWDAVFDTSAYAASTAHKSARALRGRVGLYAFVSTISAYADSKVANFDETYPLATMSEADAAAINTNEDVGKAQQFYGAQKVLCEREVVDVFGERALLIRTGLLVGPHDSTDRFTYWVRRVAEGGEMLIPNTPDQVWQLIDARDLCTWTLSMIERELGGVFNVTGEQIAMGNILDACKRESVSSAMFVPVSENFLVDEQVAGWEHLPLWLPSNQPDYAGFWACNIDKAKRAGLTLRPISDTIRDTLAWDATRDHTSDLKMGLKREREQELIAKWKSQRKN